jgi:hypothetical protein
MAIITHIHGGLAIDATEDFQFKTEMTNHIHISEMTKYPQVSQINDVVANLIPNVMSTMDMSSVVGSKYLTTAAESNHSHTDYQRMGNYLTTAAESIHTHEYQSRGDYLTTAMLSENTSLYQPIGNYLTTIPTHTHEYQSTGVYLTTGALSNHTHGGFTGTNITGTYNSGELQLSVAAPGGGGVNRSFVEIMQGERLTRVFNVTASQFSNRPMFIPFWLDGEGLVASTVRFLVSFVTNARPPIMTYGAAIYTTNNTSQMGLLCSTTATMNYASNQSASYSGIRAIDITGMTTPIPEGRVILGLFFSGAATGSMDFSLYGGDGVANFAGYLSGASGTATTDNTVQFLPWWGRYSANSGGFPSAVNRTQIYGGRSADLLDLYAVIKQI